MDGDSIATLIKLTLLLIVIGASVLVMFRGRMGQALQQAAIWFFIFLGAVLAIGVWDDVANIATPSQSVMIDGEAVVVEVPRKRDGHYHLILGINGTDVPFIIDTGATHLVLTRQDAERVGLIAEDLRFFGRAMTANGEVETAAVRLDQVSLGGVIDENVRAVVNGGEMRQSLLGMSYLQEFGRIEIENNTLRLIR